MLFQGINGGIAGIFERSDADDDLLAFFAGRDWDLKTGFTYSST